MLRYGRMRFSDRKDAGQRLAYALADFKEGAGTVVVALPRGGVVLGRVIADALDAPLDLVVPRKIGARENEEYAIGAVTESGDTVWNETERARADDAYIGRTVAAERKEAQRRLAAYRKGMPPRELAGKTVILVDDGIATGLTMRAAVATVRGEKPSRLVVAVPVAPPDAVRLLEKEVDKVVVLHQAASFMAVGQFYGTFDQVEDDEVVAMMAHERR